MTLPRTTVRAITMCVALAVVLAPALAGLGAASSSAAATASAGARRAPMLWISGPGPVISPNGDGRLDKARMSIRLEQRATVSVSVLLRTKHGSKRIKRPVNLGEHRTGEVLHWSWNGRPDGSKRIVPDDDYAVRVVGKTRDGKKYVRKTSVRVDTVFRPHRLKVNAKTLYPSSTQVHDELGFRLADPTGDYSIDDVRKGVLRITKRNGNLVYSSGPHTWRGSRYPVTWDGVNNNGRQVQSGTYFAAVRGKDAAQNTGQTPRVKLHVSDKKLTVQTDTRTVTPDATFLGTYVCSDEFPSCNEDDYDACGSVVPSTVYPQPGSLSYRSKRTCAASSYDYARGFHSINDLVDTPRGLVVTKVTMRGRPTNPGETDTAQLTVTNPTPWEPWPTATSPVTADESTTTVAAPPVDPQLLVHAPATGWVVTTRGDDSFDVADYTVEYTYLMPR